MTTFAPPTRRGDFLYSSVLYADPGNGNHHARASLAELKALLRPEAPNLYTKGRKPEVAIPAKDPAWHYYSAQLLHYGLPFTKDKNGAKVRLLDAMNQVQLEVPAWISNLESELKKEWEAENRKLKKGPTAAKSSKGMKSDGPRSQSTNATQGANGGVNFTVNLTLSGLPMADHLGLQQASSSSSPKKPSPAKRKRAESPSALPGTPKKAARVKKEPATKRSGPTIKQEHYRSPKASTPSRSRIKNEEPYSNVHSSPQYSPNPSQPSLLISGTYTIHCETATSIFGDYDLSLPLSRDSAHGVWWATFRWGAWDGIIQMNPGPSSSSALDRPCFLGWRLRDLETGRLTFGRKCTGEMTFFRDQGLGVRGYLFEVPEVGTVKFEGRRVPGRSCEDDLKHEWDAFVTEAYQR